jgi:hypothetical protein
MFPEMVWNGFWADFRWFSRFAGGGKKRMQFGEWSLYWSRWSGQGSGRERVCGARGLDQDGTYRSKKERKKTEALLQKYSIPKGQKGNNMQRQDEKKVFLIRNQFFFIQVSNFPKFLGLRAIDANHGKPFKTISATRAKPFQTISNNIPAT